MDEKKLAELMRSVIHDEIQVLKDEMNGRFDRIEDVQREMIQMLNDIRTEARSHLGQVEEVQKRQQRVVEMLSSRSVQQEADMRAIQDDVAILREKFID